MAINLTRRNTIKCNVEDIVLVATQSLADVEGISVSTLVRNILVSYLAKAELLPDKTVKELAGVRD
jgi:hypothetical protein